LRLPSFPLEAEPHNGTKEQGGRYGGGSVFEREVLPNARVADFDRVTVQEAVIVRFTSSSRDEIIRICLNRMSGDFIWAEHMPPADEKNAT